MSEAAAMGFAGDRCAQTEGCTLGPHLEGSPCDVTTTAPTPDDGLREAARLVYAHRNLILTADDASRLAVAVQEALAPTPPDGGLRAAVEALCGDDHDLRSGVPGMVRLNDLLEALAAHPAPTPVAGEGDGLAAVVAVAMSSPTLSTERAMFAYAETAERVAAAIRAAGWVKP